jgi:hypothetical protein
LASEEQQLPIMPAVTKRISLFPVKDSTFNKCYSPFARIVVKTAPEGVKVQVPAWHQRLWRNLTKFLPTFVEQSLFVGLFFQPNSSFIQHGLHRIGRFFGMQHALFLHNIWSAK